MRICLLWVALILLRLTQEIYLHTDDWGPESLWLFWTSQSAGRPLAPYSWWRNWPYVQHALMCGVIVVFLCSSMSCYFRVLINTILMAACLLIFYQRKTQLKVICCICSNFYSYDYTIEKYRSVVCWWCGSCQETCWSFYFVGYLYCVIFILSWR